MMTGKIIYSFTVAVKLCNRTTLSARGGVVAVVRVGVISCVDQGGGP